MYRENKSGLQILELEVTNKCNLNCKHCYVDKSAPEEMEFSFAENLIKQANDMDVNRLIFTGGEPLLHKNIFELASLSKELGIPQVELFTNGILISDKNVKKMSVFDSVQMSIDVPPGRAPSFRQDYSRLLEDRIELLKKNNIDVNLMATLSRSTMPFVEELIDFADKKGVKISFDRFHNVFREKELEKEELSSEELKKSLEKLYLKRKEGYDVGCSDPLLFLVDSERMSDLIDNAERKNGIVGGCMAGIAALYISSSGDVFACPFIRIVVGNVRKDSLHDVWSMSKVLNLLRNRENLKGKCKTCEYRAACGGCRQTAFSESGDILGEDDICWFKQ